MGGIIIESTLFSTVVKFFRENYGIMTKIKSVDKSGGRFVRQPKEYTGYLPNRR